MTVFQKGCTQLLDADSVSDCLCQCLRVKCEDDCYGRAGTSSVFYKCLISFLPVFTQIFIYIFVLTWAVLLSPSENTIEKAGEKLPATALKKLVKNCRQLFWENWWKTAGCCFEKTGKKLTAAVLRKLVKNRRLLVLKKLVKNCRLLFWENW